MKIIIGLRPNNQFKVTFKKLLLRIGKAAFYFYIIIVLTIGLPPVTELQSRIQKLLDPLEFKFLFFQSWAMFSRPGTGSFRYVFVATLDSGQILKWETPQFNKASYSSIYLTGRFAKLIVNSQVTGEMRIRLFSNMVKFAEASLQPLLHSPIKSIELQKVNEAPESFNKIDQRIGAIKYSYTEEVVWP